MKSKKTEFIFSLVAIIAVLAAMAFIFGGKRKEKTQNIGDIICGRINEEIPVSDINILNNSGKFVVEAKAEKEKIFLFFEEKLGETGEKLRFLSPLLPEEMNFRCEIRFEETSERNKVKPVITQMSLNEYEIPASVLENIVDFPLISSGF